MIGLNPESQNNLIHFPNIVSISVLLEIQTCNGKSILVLFVKHPSPIYDSNK